MHPILNIAIYAVREAGKLINKYYGMFSSINHVKFNENLLNISNTSAYLIANIIKKFYPNHIFLNIYQNDEKKNIFSKTQWIVDPLNGFRNFANNLPHFSISIAVQINLKTEISVIYDPIRNELFTAIRGQGAQLNGYRIRIKKNENIKYAILSSSSDCMKNEYNSDYCSFINSLLLNYQSFRCTGSVALDLAYVAAGRFSLFFNVQSKIKKKFISGDLLVRESGGVVTDFFGGHDYLISGNILAGHPNTIKKILSNIQDIFNLKNIKK